MPTGNVIHRNGRADAPPHRQRITALRLAKFAAEETDMTGVALRPISSHGADIGGVDGYEVLRQVDRCQRMRRHSQTKPAQKPLGNHISQISQSCPTPYGLAADACYPTGLELQPLPKRQVALVNIGVEQSNQLDPFAGMVQPARDLKGNQAAERMPSQGV